MGERLKQRKVAKDPSYQPAQNTTPSAQPRALGERSYSYNLPLDDGERKASLSYYNKTVYNDKNETLHTNTRFDWIIMAAIAILAMAIRMYEIHHPAGVVFDEVHFGKFASFYIRREFFFDVHPPLAKMMLGFAGWLIGYDGHFEFENIGDDYIKNNVPYIGLRAMPALLGSITPGVVYGIMKESGYPRLIALFSAMLIVLDNGHIVQTRLILLDAPLILFMALSMYSYIRFYKLRYREFTNKWWLWLFGTGFFLALTISCKMVGLFTFLTIGTAVAIDLWNLLDIKKGLSMDDFARHFLARAGALIVFPAIVYLFWFWVHFNILIYSGPGDDFMSPTFQATLIGNPLTLQSQDIKYYDTIVLKHKQTKAFLHSHVERYPLKYDDGRISSQGQQVTGYPFNDTNNHWIVEPTKDVPDSGRGRVVRNRDTVRLLHVNTKTYLLTHDVASPSMPTNQEFTTWPADDSTRYNDTLFKIEIDEGHDGMQWKSKSGHFSLIHVPTRVAMWTFTDPPLPDWGFKQQEINGNKNPNDRTNIWFVDDIIKKPDETEVVDKNEPKRKRKHMNFFRKFFELQIAMIEHNAGLTDSHPYATGPINWPFLLSGISFWTSASENKQQVYMIGNFAGWWLCVAAISVFVGVLGADQLARRRGLAPVPDTVRNRLYNSGGFYLMAWVYHYAPFYTMNRQLFLHHYLPAHLASTLVAGAVLNFVVTESINYPVSLPGLTTRLRPKTYAEITKAMRIAVPALIGLVFAAFYFLSPLTYGNPGLDPDAVNRRRVLSSGIAFRKIGRRFGRWMVDMQLPIVLFFSIELFLQPSELKLELICMTCFRER